MTENESTPEPITIGVDDMVAAERELMALDEPLPDHDVKVESTTECRRCLLISAYAVTMVQDKRGLQN